MSVIQHWTFAVQLYFANHLPNSMTKCNLWMCPSFSSSSYPSIIMSQTAQSFNPILHELLEIHYCMGRSKWFPLIKIYQNDSNLVKMHVLAKINYCCPLLMHLKLNYYHFWLKKGQKNCGQRGFEPRHRRVPPLGCIWKKLST